MMQQLSEFDLDLLRVFVKYKIVPEIVLRNQLIRKEYREMKKASNEKCQLIREKLAEKYYLSTKSIEAILYEKGDNVPTFGYKLT